MRVTPASRLGLLLGRVLRDTLVLLIQAALLTLIAVAFGLHVPALGALITVGIVGMLGISLSSLSYAAGLWLKSEDALAPLLNMISVPALLLSGILLPMELAPRWLQRIAAVNPFSHVVDGARAAFRDDLGSSLARRRAHRVGAARGGRPRGRDADVPARICVTAHRACSTVRRSLAHVPRRRR